MNRHLKMSSMVRTFLVIGDPIDHSLSPNLHNAAFRDLGLDCTYMAYRVLRGELGAGIESCKRIGAAGFNVTIPHKVEVTQYLDELDEAAASMGAVNTVAASDRILKGYNTDRDGFLDPLRRRGISIGGASVLLLGAGGAARAIVAAFAAEGAGNVAIVNRTLPAAKSLADFAEASGLRAEAAGLEEAGCLAAGRDFIINATSLGMQDEPSPVPASSLSPDSTVYDIVYKPMKTDLIRKAKEMGSTIVYGYEMLLGQACRSFEIWHGMEAPYDTMKRALLGGLP